MFKDDSGPEFSLVTRAMGTSGVMCKSLIIAEFKMSMIIVVSRRIFVELGGGPNVISMLSTAKM